MSLSSIGLALHPIQGGGALPPVYALDIYQFCSDKGFEGPVVNQACPEMLTMLMMYLCVVTPAGMLLYVYFSLSRNTYDQCTGDESTEI